MKHFLGLDADDKLVSTHTHKTYKTGLGGWPVEFDLDNPDSTNPGVIGFKQNMKTKTITTVFLEKGGTVRNEYFTCTTAMSHAGGAVYSAS